MRIRIPPVWLALCSMASVQVGASVSVSLFGTFGVAGTTWLRLLFSSLILLVVAFPRGITARQFGPAALLGVFMAANGLLFAAATHRIPLGVAVAVEFCGPLGVAVATSVRTGWVRVVLPAAALTGVVLLTEPWSLGGSSQPWVGLACAAAAGAGWAAYILLMTTVGQAMEGIRGLAVSLPVGALVLTPFGLPGVVAAVTGPHEVLGALGRCLLAALLVPLSAYVLELTALRTMPQNVFGTWMSLEPAFGVVVGLVVLHQVVHLPQIPGLALVVLAGVMTQRFSTSVPPVAPATLVSHEYGDASSR